MRSLALRAIRPRSPQSSQGSPKIPSCVSNWPAQPTPQRSNVLIADGSARSLPRSMNRPCALIPARKMLLLHVHSGNLFGGVETMLLAFAECRGPLEHRFALCWDGRLAAELRAHGAAVEILGATRARYPLSI